VCCILLLAIVGGEVWQALLPDDPVYQGKTVSQWFSQIDSRSGVSHQDKAVQALVAMGDQAVPYLIKQYSAPASTVRDRLTQWLNKIPWLKLRLLSSSERHLRAYVPLMLMGPRAQAAIPQLVKLTERRNNAIDAIQLLGYIHSRPELVIPLLSGCLKEDDAMIAYRKPCVVALGRFGKDAFRAAPMLQPMLTNQDEEMQFYAATSLLGIGDSIELAVPIIGNALNNASFQSSIAIQLGELGENARPVVPLLVERIKNGQSQSADEAFIYQLRGALKKIDAEAAERVGVK